MTTFSTIGQSTYAKNAIKYIEILNKLRSMGAQSAVDLPTIVFCGNQSAGKSSLLEAISGKDFSKVRKLLICHYSKFFFDKIFFFFRSYRDQMVHAQDELWKSV